MELSRVERVKKQKMKNVTKPAERMTSVFILILIAVLFISIGLH